MRGCIQTRQAFLLVFFGAATGFVAYPFDLKGAWKCSRLKPSRDTICLRQLSADRSLFGRTLSNALLKMHSSANVAEIQTPQTHEEAVKRFLIHDVGIPVENLGSLLDGGPFPSFAQRSLQDLRFCVTFLVDEVGVPASKIAKVILMAPQLLAFPVTKLRERYRFLVDRVGIDEGKIASVIAKFPMLLKYSVTRNLGPSLLFLVEEANVPSTSIGKVVINCPGILPLSVESNLRPSLRLLQTETGLNKKQLSLVISGNPAVLALNFETNIRNKLAFLRALGLTQKQLADVLTTQPAILSLSISKIESVIDFLTNKVGIHTAKQIKNIVVTCPRLLGYSLARLEENLLFFSDELMLSEAQISHMVAHFPHALTYKVSANLRPKLRYFLSEGYTIAQISREVAASPIVLGYSLEKRIKRRFVHLSKCGVKLRLGEKANVASNVKLTRVEASAMRGITLKSMLAPSDEVFFRRYIIGATVHWLAFGTLAYDPYGAVQSRSTWPDSENSMELEGDGDDDDDDDFSTFKIDLSGLH